jgi:tRNA pseudouridine38-40 synthase
MRYLIKFSYDGTNFNGYQRQPGKRCVEEYIISAVKQINNGNESKVTSSSRTDAKVHALCQEASFTLDVDITEYKLKCALNSLIPDDIHVFEALEVDEDFHPRYMVKEKTYLYIINMGEYEPTRRNYELQFGKSLDVDKMKEAIKYFEGEHDFKNYVSDEAIKDNYIRKIYSTEIVEINNKLYIRFTGNGFMKYQVRNMVGTLIKIGLNKLDIDIIEKIFNDDSYKKYVYTAKPEGLYLERIIN